MGRVLERVVKGEWVGDLGVSGRKVGKDFVFGMFVLGCCMGDKVGFRDVWEGVMVVEER